MTDVISGVTAVYGGSFNPPHMGHRMVVENVLRDLDADRFIFLGIKVLNAILYLAGVGRSVSLIQQVDELYAAQRVGVQRGTEFGSRSHLDGDGRLVQVMHIQAIALAGHDVHILVKDNRILINGFSLGCFTHLHSAVQLDVHITGIHSIVAVGATRRYRIEGGQEGGSIIAVLYAIDVDVVHIIGCSSGDWLIVAYLDVCLCRLVNGLSHVGDVLFVTGAHRHCHQQQ